MSDENIEIRIDDKVSPGISKKLRDIAKDARTTQTAVDKLKVALKELGSANPLTKLQTELRNVNGEMAKAALASQRLSTEQARTAVTAQRLATEQQRTAAAAQRVATEQGKTATATARTGTESARTSVQVQRLGTEQARTATATAQAAAAQDRAALAALRLQQAQERGAATARRYGDAMGRLRTLLAFAGVTLTAGSIVGMADAYTTLQNKLQPVTSSQAQVNELTGEMFELANRTRSEVGATTQAFVRFDRAMKGLGRSQDDTIRLTETINKALIVSGSTTQEAQSALLQLSQAFNSGRLNGDEFRAVSENMPMVLDALSKSMGVPIGALKELGSEGKITSGELVKALDLIEAEVDANFAKTVPTIAQAFVVLRNSASQFFGEINNSVGATNGIASALLFLADNIDRLAIYAATAAAVFAGAYVYGLIAAATATGGLSAALRILRTALIRTGIGAIVVLLGELVYQMWQGADAVGGVSNYFTILGDTGKAALDWIIAGGYAMVDAFKGIALTIGATFTSLWAQVQRGFANLMAAIQGGINSMITGLNDAFTFSINNPFTGEQMAGMNGLGIQATTFADGYIKAADDSAAAAEDLSNRANAAFDSMTDRFKDLKNPIDVYNEGMSTATKQTEEAARAAGELDSTLRGPGTPADPYEPGGGSGGGKGKKGGKGGASESMSKYLADLNEELDLLKLLPREREIEQAVMEKVNKLREKGVAVSEAEIELLRERTAELAAANRVAEQENQLMNQSVYAREQALEQIRAMQNLLNNPESGFTKGDAIGSLAQGPFGEMVNGLPEMVAFRVEQFRAMYEQVAALREADIVSERSAAGLRAQIWAQEQSARLQTANTFFGSLAELASSENEKMARIGKAAAIAQTIIKTYESATSAYASMAAIPVVGPALGAAAAAAAVAAGMANVAAIRSQGTQGFMKGGYTGDLPTTAAAGVVHGQEYVFDAASTRAIGVDNLEAMRQGAGYGSGQKSSAAGAKIMGGLTVNIENYGTSKDFEVQQISEEEVRVIARDEASSAVKKEAPGVVAADIGNPNGRVSKAISNGFNTTRKR